MKYEKNKTYYVIAKLWLGEFEGFIKIGDNKEEITKLFNERYKSTEEHSFGITEESFVLYELNELLEE